MHHTEYSWMTSRELVHMIDTMEGASSLLREVAHRLDVALLDEEDDDGDDA